MNYCSNCGTALGEENKFCPNCGKELLQEILKTDSPKKEVDLTEKKSQNYTKPGFWGSILMLVGFFLPWLASVEGSSGYLIVKSFSGETLIYFIFPISGIIMLIHNISTGLPKFIVTIFGTLPIALFIYFFVTTIFLYNNNMLAQSFTSISDIGIGLWATFIGSILIIFEKSKK